MNRLLFILLKEGAHKTPKKISTSDLAILCNMSQQNTSRRLIMLEKEGVIIRTSEGIKITEKGENIGRAEYLKLKNIFEGGKIEIEGKIVEGSRQGGYYLSLKHYKDHIKERFGFVPYPGTLNIKIKEKDLIKREEILKKELVIIPGFSTQKRTYGEMFAYPGKLNNFKVVLVFPIRTHHGKEIIEVIAEKDIMKEIKNKNKIILKVD